MANKSNNAFKKEWLYVIIGIVFLLALGVFLFFSVKNLIGSKMQQGNMELILEDKQISSGDETSLSVSLKNKGKDVLEGLIVAKSNDFFAVTISHPDPLSLYVKLYPGESITKVLTVKGSTTALRTDYKLNIDFVKDGKTLNSEEIILTVTNE